MAPPTRRTAPPTPQYWGEQIRMGRCRTGARRGRGARAWRRRRGGRGSRRWPRGGASGCGGCSCRSSRAPVNLLDVTAGLDALDEAIVHEALEGRGERVGLVVAERLEDVL